MDSNIYTLFISPKLFGLFVGMMLMTGAVFATETEKKNKEVVETKIKIKKEELGTDNNNDNIDGLITNRKLRAQTGSKSKLSVSSSFNYSGGTIEDPGSRTRPNIFATNNTISLASLSGSIAAKYRLSRKDSIGVGVGLHIFTPFHEGLNVSKVNGVRRGNISNPYVSYSHLDRIGDFQSVTSVGVVGFTTNYARQNGYLASISLSETLLRDIGTTGLSVGLSSFIGGTIFDKFDDTSKENSSDYFIGLFPFLEYVINDTLTFRSVFGLWSYDHIRSESDKFTFYRHKIYQSVGLGVSVTRNIYLYPNIQFLPEDIRSDLTNVAISANINLF